MRPPALAEVLLGTYVVVCTAAIVWPGFSWVPADRPRILGLPFALAWVVGWCLTTFAVLVAFHRSHRPDGRHP